MAKSLRTKTEAQSNLRLRLSSNVSAGIRVVRHQLGRGFNFAFGEVFLGFPDFGRRLLAPGGAQAWNNREAIACHREAISRLQSELDGMELETKAARSAAQLSLNRKPNPPPQNSLVLLPSCTTR
jgi:hypothetical protein